MLLFILQFCNSQIQTYLLAKNGYEFEGRKLVIENGSPDANELEKLQKQLRVGAGGSNPTEGGGKLRGGRNSRGSDKRQRR